jgi:hypothetical protein
MLLLGTMRAEQRLSAFLLDRVAVSRLVDCGV